MLQSRAIRQRRDPHEYFSADLVDRYNDFDPTSVIEQARAFRLG